MAGSLLHCQIHNTILIVRTMVLILAGSSEHGAQCEGIQVFFEEYYLYNNMVPYCNRSSSSNEVSGSA